MSVNPKDLHVDFVLPNFNLCLFENEADEEAELLPKLRRGFQSMIENFIVHCVGHSYEDENGLAEIKTFCKRNTSNSFDNEINKRTCT